MLVGVDGNSFDFEFEVKTDIQMYGAHGSKGFPISL